MSSAGCVEVSAPSSAGTLSLPTAVALVMGSIVGTGIFTRPSAVAQYGMVGLVGFVAPQPAPLLLR
jgi:amino acid permease